MPTKSVTCSRKRTKPRDTNAMTSGASIIEMAFYDLVDLWVIKIKTPVILCARSTSRSRELSKKRRPRSEKM